MPVPPSASLLNTLISRNATANLSSVGQPTNATGDILQVICAWPVSGQYGPGSRILYYVLVAACVFAQKTEWLRNACLAAALLFPAVAALHGVVLAALNNKSAVDMDVYGAFQLCSIGILAAPVTVRLSRTYFNDPGRNIIFVWTILILMGLLSLTVEFYRINPSPCTHDDFGNPISPNAAQFPYDLQPSCGLICNVTAGPFSPMRQGSANNIYIVPAPQELTPNTATLFAAACCIPAILSLISMWNKILIINWKARFGNWSEEARMDELIEGTNGATIGRMMGVNNVVRLFLSVIEVPVFGAAVLAILIIGERNFWSTQVRYQTEPIASIGQWAPIAGTVLAALGSLYVLLANVEASGAETNPNSATIHCNCSHHHIDGGEPSDSHNRPTANKSFSNRDAQHGGSYVREIPSQNSGTLPEMQQVSARQSTPSSHSNHDDQHHSDSPNGSMHAPERIQTVDVGSRRKVRKALIAMGNFFGTAPRDWFDDSEFKRGKALDFPEIPGEEHRNRDLPQIREQYNQPRDSDGNVTPMHPEQRSRASSLHRGAPSVRDVGEGSSTPPIVRHDTLEVPSPVHHSPTRHHSSDLYFGVHE